MTSSLSPLTTMVRGVGGTGSRSNLANTLTNPTYSATLFVALPAMGFSTSHCLTPLS
ncbi:hypothetical protein DIPPA_04929 [Diplonema papillatum]|nr:hypothetical protein DIPPA_04929 [Diplonema papillatum]